MKLGIVLPQHDSGRGALLGAARMAEAAGLDSVWSYDNLRPKPGFADLLECWTALSAAAAATERITVGPLALRVTLRNAALVGHMAHSLESLAPGRVVITLGTGDASTKGEQLDSGYPWLPFTQRLEVLKNQVAVLREAAPGVRVWIGGTGRRILSTLPLADGWSYWGPVSGFAGAAAGANEKAGAGGVEVCWGGRTIDEAGLVELKALGVDHAVVAVSAGGYARRIDWLASMRPLL